MDLIDFMLDHDQWATTELLDTCRGLTDAQLDQEFDIGHRTIRETLSHFIFNIPYWTAVLNRESTEGVLSTDNLPDDRSVTALGIQHDASYRVFAGLARRLRDEQRLGDTYTDHYDVRKSAGGTIVMVIEHNAEHRSEVLHMLTRLGVPDLPEVDAGVWDYLLHNT